LALMLSLTTAAAVLIFAGLTRVRWR
jgi:hypothetical protein